MFEGLGVIQKVHNSGGVRNVPFLWQTVTKNVRGGGVRSLKLHKHQKYFVEWFSFSLSDECYMVRDVLNLFNKFLTTYCMFKEIEDWFLSILPFYKECWIFCLALIFFKFFILSIKLFLKYFWVRQAVIPSEEQWKFQLFVASSLKQARTESNNKCCIKCISNQVA